MTSVQENQHPVEDRPIFAFAAQKRIGCGSLRSVLTKSLDFRALHPDATLLFFDAINGTQVDFDLRGDLPEVLQRVKQHPYFAPSAGTSVEATNPSGPGRPRLGVVSREITLLPRHWQWLEEQPGGISVTLRKLVENASRQPNPQAQKKRRQEAASRFLSAIAGDFPGYEEVCRAIYADENVTLQRLLQEWPSDVADGVRQLLRGENESVT